MDVLDAVTKLLGQNITAVGLLGIVVILILTGLLQAKRVVDARIAEIREAHATNLTQANTRADEWKAAAEGKDVVIKTQGEVIAEQSTVIAVQARGGQVAGEFFGTVMKAGGGANVGTQEATA